MRLTGDGLYLIWTIEEKSHSLSLSRILFHFSQITPHTNPVQITIHGQCNSYSLTWGWQNSYQTGVVTHNQKGCLPVWRKVPRCTARRNNCGPKTLPLKCFLMSKINLFSRQFSMTWLTRVTSWQGNG